jgi:TolB protein
MEMMRRVGYGEIAMKKLERNQRDRVLYGLAMSGFLRRKAASRVSAPGQTFAGSALAQGFLVLALVAAGSGTVHAQGVFGGSSDLGNTQHGTTAFDKATKSYEITGGGSDLWGASDAFHYAWQQVDGEDWYIQADVAVPPGGSQPNEKAVLMFRQSLDPDSAYVDVAIHADGHITLQWRLAQGATTEDTTAPMRNAKTLRIERRGNLFVASATGDDGQMHEFATKTVTFQDPVYLGLGVCAHDPNGLATVKFSNLKIDRTGMAPASAPQS